MSGQSAKRASDVKLTAVLCSGSDCAKDERSAYRALRRCLDEADVGVVRSKCLDVCHGPVMVVADDDGSAVVIEKVRSKRRRADVATAIADGRLGKVAAAAPVVDGGKRQRVALRKAGRTVGRRLIAR